MNDTVIKPNQAVSSAHRSALAEIRKPLLNALWYVLMAITAAIVILPFLWMISTALKDTSEVFAYPPIWIPKALRWDNFVAAWHAAPFGRYFVNSTFVAVAVTFGQLVTCSLAAYAFARLHFKGKNLLFSLFMSTTMISTQVTLIPSFLIIKTLDWQDTYLALIVPFLANAFGIFMLRQAFIGVPNELEDAAKLDGCSHFRFLWQVVIPLTRPTLAAQALFTFMGNWNSYLWPLIVTNREEMRTLQIGLRYFVDSEDSTSWGAYMAAALLVTLPVVLVYFFVQKSFVEGIARTGLKG